MAQQDLFDITPEQQASKLQFYRCHSFRQPPLVSPREISLSGKTAVVTGANAGIGIECSRQLLDLGLQTLILAVRDESRGQTIQVWKLDYASYDFVTSFAQFEHRIDIVILNTGVNRGFFQLNAATGHEEELQTNYLSTALLVLLVLKAFQKAASDVTIPPMRIVIVSSDTAAWAVIPGLREL